MRAMKDSGVPWFGKIPSDVSVSKVGRHYDITLGKMLCDVPKSDDMVYIPYICAANVHFDGVDISELKRMWFSPDEIKLYTVQNRDLLIVEGGAGAGGCAIVHGIEGTIGIQNSIQIIRSKDGGDNRYLCYALQSLVKGGYMDIACNKATIPHFTKDKLSNSPYIVWSIEERRKIADFLDTQCAHIDDVISKTKSSIEEYKKLKQAVITEAVTKGIRPGRKMKDSGIEWIGEIPEEWRIGKIKVGVTKVGSGKTPSGGAEVYSNEGVLFLRSQNVYDTGIVLDESATYITEKIDEDMASTRVYPNDVLLNITGGSIGRCCIFPNELKRANVNQHVCIIRVRKDVFLARFMQYYWISSLGKKAISLYQTGGNREGMTGEAIKNSPIPLITLAEQHEIADYLDSKCSSIDALISKKEQFITELSAYKKSLIYEYVTGKKEVPA